MKNLVKSLAVAAAAVMVLGLGVNMANASGVDFRVGVNLGVPVVPVRAYAPPRVYVHSPAPVYHVERVRYIPGHDYRYRNDYRHGWYRNDYRHGWYRNNYRHDWNRHDYRHDGGHDRGYNGDQRGQDRNHDGGGRR